MQGDKRIDKLMLPVLNAINRHVKDRDAKTDIYNRAYEAVMISMVVKTSTTGVKTPSSIENTNPDYYKHDAVKPSEDNGWISVNDRLPEKDEIYLAYPTLTGKVYPVRYFARVGWRTIQFESVTAQEPTHWMPLPSAPESEE